NKWAARYCPLGPIDLLKIKFRLLWGIVPAGNLLRLDLYCFRRGLAWSYWRDHQRYCEAKLASPFTHRICTREQQRVDLPRHKRPTGEVGRDKARCVFRDRTQVQRHSA